MKTPTLYAGLRIYNWTVVRKMPDDNKTKSPNLKKRVKVKCLCGSPEEVLPIYYLTRANPKKSCGCLNQGLPTKFKLTYNSWYMMNTRCQDPNHVAYADYGGRGISVCPRWHKSNPHGFANFLSDMGERPHKDLTLDRYPNVDGNYEPSNCRWATWTQQNNNKRSNRDYQGEISEDSASEISVDPKQEMPK